MTRRATTTHGRTLRLPPMTRGQLRREARDLRHQLDGAEQFMAGQVLAIADRDEHIAALGQAIAQLQADRVDAGVLAQQLATAQAENRRLRAENIAVKARLQDATAITVPPMRRDTSHPDDHVTEPIYVQTLRDDLVRQEQQQATPQVKTLADAFGGRA